MIPHTDVKHDRIRFAILGHLHGFWPNSSISVEDWDEGPIRENVPGFRVLKLTSDTLQNPVVYVTEGCFASEPGHIRHEFFLMSPHEDYQHVETLSMLANF